MMELDFGKTKETLLMLAAKRVPLGPWQRGLFGFVQLMRPNPTVKSKLSSIWVGTFTLFGLRSWEVNRVAVGVSLKFGS